MHGARAPEAGLTVDEADEKGGRQQGGKKGERSGEAGRVGTGDEGKGVESGEWRGGGEWRVPDEGPFAQKQISPARTQPFLNGGRL